MTGRIQQTRFSQTRCVKIGGRPTSVSLEASFWDAFHEIARVRETSIHRLAEEVQGSDWNRGNLSGALREFILDAYRSGRKREGKAA